MTEHDRKTDAQLLEALDQIKVPAIDEAAKRRAIDQAVAEFKAAQQEKAKNKQGFFQGLGRLLRPIVSVNKDNRRRYMSFNQRFLITGMTAACAGLIAFGVLIQYGPGLDRSDVSDVTDSVIPEDSPAVAQSPVDEKFALSKQELRNRPQTAVPAKPKEVTAKPETLREQASATAPQRPIQEVAVAGERGAQKKKRDASSLVDSMQSPEFDQFADRHTAQALQRIAGTQLASGVSGPSEAEAEAVDFMASPGVVVDDDLVPTPGYKDEGRDKFKEFEQNPVKLVAEEPVSTFSVDVDTASYSFVRRQLSYGILPQSDAVRIEEMINYFDYAYPLPKRKKEPFQATVAVSDSPWAAGRKLLHIGIKGYDIEPEDKPRSNLVFLLDVSGSMNSPDKLPLVKQSMELLLTSLQPEDTVAIAVYAGAAGTVLEPTKVKEKQKILDAMRRLSAGGSTAGAQGIRLAYELAETNFDKQAINRVILATDGDFNVGITNDRELQSFIERKRDKGIFLSVLGFGQGNYRDEIMQTLAQNGNGVAAYIDTLSEAQKVLVDEATSTLFPIAKDVKIQVEFNPDVVSEYRLIGYETRHLNREDFNNDAVDAGDIGAGHTVTALYEITPVGSAARLIDESRYAKKPSPVKRKLNEEYAFLKIRYKLPEQKKSKLITQAIDKKFELNTDKKKMNSVLARETRFATAVAGFAQLLKGGKYTGEFAYDDVIELAQNNKGDDKFGYRTEFIQLVRKAKTASAMRAK